MRELLEDKKPFINIVFHAAPDGAVLFFWGVVNDNEGKEVDEIKVSGKCS